VFRSAAAEGSRPTPRMDAMLSGLSSDEGELEDIDDDEEEDEEDEDEDDELGEMVDEDPLFKTEFSLSVGGWKKNRFC
jgi:hypothetical protein